MVPTPELVKAANMVFVTMNYRLGPLGFLALNVKDPATSKPLRGNYGLMDQYMAMEWVKENSGLFGANPNKVCVPTMQHSPVPLHVIFLARIICFHIQLFLVRTTEQDLVKFIMSVVADPDIQ